MEIKRVVKAHNWREVQLKIKDKYPGSSILRINRKFFKFANNKDRKGGYVYKYYILIRMPKRKFVCSEIECRKILFGSVAYFHGRIVCQECYNRLKENN